MNKHISKPPHLNIFLLFFLIPVWLIMKLGEIVKIVLIHIFKLFKYLIFFFFRLTKSIINYVLLFFGRIYSSTRAIKLPSFSFHLPNSFHLSKPKIAISKFELKSKSKKKKTKKSSQWRFLTNFIPTPVRLVIFLTFFFITFFTYSFYLVILAHDLPSPEKLSHTDSPATTEFYDRNGVLLYRLYEGKNRSPIKLNQLPKSLINATIASEDKNFYSHKGVDFFAIIRAVVAYVQNNQVQGGSTITQQLIKNTLLTPERTLTRKVREIFLAFWTERLYTKDDILQMYFNEVPYGGPAWGIAAAAQTYFDKDVKDLTLAESSFLAGLPASPTTYSPYGSNPELGKMRQKEVLRRMTEEGFITQALADKTYGEELKIKSPNTTIKAPHFVMYIRALLAQKYGEKTVSQGGLKVMTSLDLKTQEMAEKTVADEVKNLASLNVSNGAAMITDAKTGQILAMVGSKNYWDESGGNFNVTTALRQPGSSIKPITYATGFKLGYSPATILLDTPVTFRNDWEVYSPVNYDSRFHGPVTIRTALGSSYNIPAVKMLALVGIPEMIQTAKDLGITTFTDPNRYGLSLTLGGGEVKLIDMMSVYGTLSQNGIKYPVEGVLKITDTTGKVLEDNTKPVGTKALNPGIAYLISDILADNKARTPAFGPNSLLIIPNHIVAVKTGTTDSKKDNWTFGFTPEYVVGVWVGNNDNSPMNPNLASGVTGAAPIWHKLMTTILEDKQNLAFTRPNEVTEGSADGKKDLVVSGIAQRTVVGQGRRRIRDDNTQEEKDTITFTDPFSQFQAEPNQLQPISIP